jgi:branched-chain amino acid transport system permease protein
VITILKQWLQDWLPQVLGQSGNFEIIVFGLAMVLVLQKARAGLWPLILRLLPSRAVVREVPAGRCRAASRRPAARCCSKRAR